MARALKRERDLLGQAVADLVELLPDTWRIGRLERSADAKFDLADLALRLDAPNGTSAFIAVEAKSRVTPRAVDLLVGRLAHIQANDSDWQMVVVAPWIGAAAQERLIANGIHYLDLTGNVAIRLDEPALFVRTMGATRDPNPSPRGESTLKGASAGRVVRLLTDVRPPYNVSQVAAATGVSISYVSRLLHTLDNRALIERDRRGGVTEVDWAALLRAWAEQYGVFTTNDATGYIAATGPRDLLVNLGESGLHAAYRAVTGSFVAAAIAPVAAPAQLHLYVDNADATAQELGLMPADRGADVILLEPFDFVVLDRLRQNVLPPLKTVCPSQLAVDLLTGNGRMPAEGDALVSWMADNVQLWRKPTLDEVGLRGEIDK